VDAQYEEQKYLSNRRKMELTTDQYYRHDEINKYLDRLSESNENVKIKTAGKSTEGRDIKIVTITKGDGKSRNSVFIDAGIHAREWIAPATAIYLIQQLVDKGSNFSQLLDKMDFVFMPVVNPDGYEYSHNIYRLWRKTRSRQVFGCTGVDANRNYDAEWSKTGSSSSSCSETYHGKKTFSEPEAKASGDVMQELKGKCKFFLTFHSYGYYLIYPYAHSTNLPDNWKDNDDVARAGADAMRKATGTNYTVGPIATTLYPASGSSVDYAHIKAEIPIAIVMELARGGYFGFDLPAKEIDKNVKEVS
jgi:murein tripeptide amidase MpaA